MRAEAVVLGRPDGRELGVVDRQAAHRSPGVLHAAVSVMVVDDAGRALIQRRAQVKALFASWWSNSCCTHPAPGERAVDAGPRRVGEELGLAVADVVEVGAFTYRAVDLVSGLVEHERDTVLLARLPGSADPVADPSEVGAWEWVPLDALAGRCLTPWAGRVHALGLAALRAGRRRGGIAEKAARWP